MPTPVKQFLFLAFQSPFSRFIKSGTINTLLTYLAYLSLLWLGLSATMSYTFVFVLGILSTYFLHLKITFRSTHNRKKMLLFLAAYLVLYLVGLGTLNTALAAGVTAAIAGLTVTLINIPLSFFVFRFVLK